MKVFPSLQEAAKSGEVQHLAVGFFDGVHRGHQLVFDSVRRSRENFSILTFWPHPQSVLAPERAPRLITGLEHKLRLFQRMGATSTVLVSFDREFAEIQADGFLDLLARSFPRLMTLACGPNFHFGKNREGTSPKLAAWATARGLEFHIPPMQTGSHGQVISSSRIRSHLHKGDLAGVAGDLGRPYGLWGMVVRGQGNGNKLGFPTANLATSDDLLLPPGVYGGLCQLADGTSWRCAINIGLRPTISPSSSELVIEAHLLDFKGDLYGLPLEIQPTSFIRAERPFASLQELQAQIQIDVAQVAQQTY